MDQTNNVPDIDSTYRSTWPRMWAPSHDETPVDRLPNPGHGRFLPPRLSSDGLVNYCLSCPRVISSRQRFCGIHRAMMNVWLNELSARRTSAATPALLKSLRDVDEQVEELLGRTRPRPDALPRDAEVINLLACWRRTVRPQLIGED